MKDVCDLCHDTAHGKPERVITTGVSGYEICLSCYHKYAKSELSSLDFVRQYPQRTAS